MAAPQVDVSYHDLSSLNELRALASKDKVAAVRQAAQQFESVFMGMLMSSMRKANQTFEEDNPLNSQATGFYRDMYDSQLTAELSKKGTLGLADLMVQQLAPEAAKSKAASQVSAPNRFTVQTEKALPLAKESQALALPVKQALKLDAERIVYPTVQAQIKHIEQSAITLGSETAISAPQNVQKAGVLQQLDAEMLVSAVPAEAQAKVVPAVAPDVAVVDEGKPAIDSTDDSLAALSALTGPEAEFVKGILPAARQAARQLGLEPLALVAQAALETGWGQRMFKAVDGRESYNLFGIKAQPDWQGNVAVVDTLEYRQGIARQEKAKFRVYDSLQAGLQDYVDFIRQQPRYQDAVAVSNDTANYFQQLQAAGYATDPNYAQKILQVMNGSVLKEVRNLLKNSGQTEL
ncbi:glucosaminidase domain-containing protein [Rheinheimera texasensis]|uniref:glucosaminidase domain-containing protein n=1 Tax=Rheinheimera texasensis TaxID=306205 RepID=UPI0004E10D9B|nr:glucosaminidase domain-containing protein [Rheinheimera texasensis]